MHKWYSVLYKASVKYHVMVDWEAFLLMPIWFQTKMEISHRILLHLKNIAEVGLGLIGFGIFFTFLAVILFFDRGLLALGNVRHSRSLNFLALCFPFTLSIYLLISLPFPSDILADRCSHFTRLAIYIASLYRPEELQGTSYRRM